MRDDLMLKWFSNILIVILTVRTIVLFYLVITE